MNSVHDMGGMQGFGPVQPERDEPVFHAEWKKRALAVTLAMGASGLWSIDHSRAARESLPPALYLGTSYYGIWLEALERMMQARGLVTAEELSQGVMRVPAAPVARVLKADQVAAALARGTPADRPANPDGTPPRFAPGDRVLARNLHPVGHTRLPRYVRGHVGTVEAVRGCHVFPDTHVSQPTPPFDDTAHWLYTVVFDARQLWGDAARAGDTVSVDAWEPCLAPGPTGTGNHA
jgi:nitrile hydratase subunit beta